ncbi:hypothetical protein KR093_004402 [Drosophila rubida]|uniref:Uncharacterized protein n=1 Tax=Drosophila rubida TaxID=30044 RepID=A0AAD4JWL7_9MUSC|nr:hypothetical protein KR093_004402 [Drosophila rubida]
MTSITSLYKCRACLVPQNSSSVRYDMHLLPMLAHKFFTCTALSVEEEDSLPSVLCVSCKNHLEQFYAFRERCIAADAQLRADRQENLQTKPYEHELQEAEEVSQLQLCNKKIVTKRRVKKQRKEVEETVSQDAQQLEEQSSCYKCDICDSRFLVEHRLQAHKRQHEGLMPYPCTEAGCERAFNRLHCLSQHLKQHSGTSRWFSCEQEGCSKRYRHKPTLMMHMRRSHKLGPELKSHVCEFCGKVFNSSAVLNDHRYTHKDKSELPHACSESDCQRRFASKEKLKVHLLRHAGIKNFSCPYCGMRKTTRNELKIHMNYHTLERTWPCRFCSKVCNSSGNLKMHVRTVHERARDYACSYCERSFAKPDTRKYHEMTHTGEKPNECEECGKRFTQPAALRTHRKIHERQRKEADANFTLVTLAPSSRDADNS